MRSLRFNHVFTLLMLLAALSAFVLPPNFTDGGRAQVQGLFAPVARPARSLAAAIYGRAHPPQVVDHGAPPEAPRTDADIIRENENLRLQVSSLQSQLDALKELNADRASLGDVRQLCTPVTVMGSDPGVRDSLSLAASTVQGLKAGQPVLHARGIAGRISRAGVGGAQVLLITDAASKISGSFGQFRVNSSGQTEFIRFANLLPLVEGLGRGKMIVRNITLKQTQDAGLKVNDYLVLDDSNWPMNLKGYLLGRVAGIAAQTKNPLFAEILVDPGVNLEALRDVMVMVR